MTEKLPDVVDNQTVTLICGSAAGDESAKAGYYYSHPTNQFWKVLHEADLTDRQIDPIDFKLVSNYGLGLTDLAKHVSGSDESLRGRAYDPGTLRKKIEKFRPCFLAFNGKKPAECFLSTQFDVRKPVCWGMQHECISIGRTRIFVLPSTSGANRRWWPADGIEHWRKLASLHKRMVK